MGEVARSKLIKASAKQFADNLPGIGQALKKRS